MLLSYVDLRAGTRNDSAQTNNENCDNENETRHTPANRPLRPCYNSMPFVCQGFTAAQRSRKSNAIVSFPSGGDREQQTLLAGCEITRLC